MKIPKNTKIQHFLIFSKMRKMTKITKIQKNTFFAKNEKTRNIRFSQKCKKSYFLKNDVFEIFRKNGGFSKRAIWGYFGGGQNRGILGVYEKP